jgi:hypothetical protein
VPVRVSGLGTAVWSSSAGWLMLDNNPYHTPLLHTYLMHCQAQTQIVPVCSRVQPTC